MFVFKRKNIIIVAVLILTFITFIICGTALSVNPIEDTDVKIVRVVLDAGHGGIDNGATGIKTGVKESELNLKIVKKIERYLADAGISVVLTRTTDAGLYGMATSNLKRKDMEKRKEIILKSNPTLVVSVHMNKFSVTTRRGAQVFYKTNDELGKTLALNVQKSFNQMESASRECSALSGDYFILNCSEFPSIITECGFLSNPEDEALLITDEYQEEIAYTIFKGIINYLSESSFNFCH